MRGGEDFAWLPERHEAQAKRDRLLGVVLREIMEVNNSARIEHQAHYGTTFYLCALGEHFCGTSLDECMRKAVDWIRRREQAKNEASATEDTFPGADQ